MLKLAQDHVPETVYHKWVGCQWQKSIQIRIRRKGFYHNFPLWSHMDQKYWNLMLGNLQHWDQNLTLNWMGGNNQFLHRQFRKNWLDHWCSSCHRLSFRSHIVSKSIGTHLTVQVRKMNRSTQTFLMQWREAKVPINDQFAKVPTPQVPIKCRHNSSWRAFFLER